MFIVFSSYYVIKAANSPFVGLEVNCRLGFLVIMMFACNVEHIDIHIYTEMPVVHIDKN